VGVRVDGVALMTNFGLIALFGMQHSVMARPGFKRWLTRFVRTALNVARSSSQPASCWFCLYWQWRPMTQVVWHVDSSGSRPPCDRVRCRIPARAAVDVHSRSLRPFRLKAGVSESDAEGYTHLPFKVTYCYKFVRHPLYLGLLLAFWRHRT